MSHKTHLIGMFILVAVLIALAQSGVEFTIQLLVPTAAAYVIVNSAYLAYRRQFSWERALEYTLLTILVGWLILQLT